MNPVLQLASRSELALLLDLVAAYRREDRESFDRQKCAAALQCLIDSESLGRAWLIRDEARPEAPPVGYLLLCFGFSLEFLGRDAFIDEFFIVAEKRGRGIGKAVLQQVRQEAAALGVKALHLEVAPGNTAAERAYLTAGFKSRRQYYLMSLRLDTV